MQSPGPQARIESTRLEKNGAAGGTPAVRLNPRAVEQLRQAVVHPDRGRPARIMGCLDLMEEAGLKARAPA
jgi:hypothetical protein